MCNNLRDIFRVLDIFLCDSERKQWWRSSNKVTYKLSLKIRDFARSERTRRGDRNALCWAGWNGRCCTDRTVQDRGQYLELTKVCVNTLSRLRV